jgi:2'-5' RNA ligase
MQHYFIGVKLPFELSQQLVHSRDNWQLEQHTKITTCRGFAYHVSLFRGSGKRKANSLMQALDEIDSLKTMIVTLSGVSTFGNPATPRVIYAAIEEQPKLIELQSAVLEKCLDLSLPVDSKKFVPHITLAKKWRGQQEHFSKDMHIASNKFTVKEFSLYSINPGVIPSYQAIHTITLKD